MALPKQHPCYREYTEKAAVLQIEAGTVSIMNCKRDEYNVRYRKFEEQDTLGDKIRFVRLHSGLTIDQLADKLGIDRTTLMRYEHDEISEDHINTPLLLEIEQICSVPRYTLLDDYLLFFETCKLKELRKQFHITQKQLAAQLGVDHRTISRWEQKNSRPSQEVWRSVMEYFNMISSEETTNSSFI